ncbi:MAG: diguanylate cyclase [Ruminococcus sp.]|nr:diguanylate cyclase [Ruminococcus sp.]
MTDLRLIVINDVKSLELDTRYPEEQLPNNLIITFSEYIGGLPVPEGRLLLLITDDAGKARAEITRAQERVLVIYVGSAGECADFSEGLYDFWNISDGEEMLHRKYLKAVADLKVTFDADFYKRTLLTTVNSMPDMLWFKRKDGIHTLVNDEFCRVVGRDKSDIIGRDHSYVWRDPEAGPDADFDGDESDEIALSIGKTYICDEPIRTGGVMKQFTTYKTPVYDMFGNLFGTVGIGRDVTNFSNMGIELSILIENLPYPMTIFTSDWKVVKMNTVFADLAGAITEAQQRAFDYKQWKSENLEPAGELTENSELHSTSQECLIVYGGEKHNFNVTEIEIRDFFDNISGYFVALQDITYQRAYESEILRAANTDMLTGLFNRRYFYQYLGELRGREFTLLYMDLDRFKEINDNFGHTSGDDALIKTAELISENYPGATCFRLGGDEFAVIDGSSSTDELELRSRRLEEAIYSAFKHYGFDTMISIGINHCDGSSENIDDIFTESDAKMYEIKKLHHDEYQAGK